MTIHSDPVTPPDAGADTVTGTSACAANAADSFAAAGPAQSLPVYRAGDFRVTSGVNLGEPVTDASELEMDDVFGLDAGAQISMLSFYCNQSGEQFVLASDTETGHAGADLFLDCCATFMSPDGSTIEALILIETDNGLIAGTYLLPLAPVETGKDYALVQINRDNARARFAEVACVSFTRGTLITMSNGLQRPIEDLRPGDKVLTRNNGPREIHWVGQQTVRASGALAPIVIRKGTLNNENDLVLSPNHRLFIYQRRDHMGAGRSEIMVKAERLINGTSVVQSVGGFVEYFQLLFEQHEIIYAEGIAAESLYVDTRVKPVLPAALRNIMSSGDAPGNTAALIELEDSAVSPDLLRSASGG
ncbi:Hint domain-containing protein [Candidatus Halocynthiibacter alkanivorans]|uniref:Hint domain-containing protein n=1 Tax=Candidatus Halocynthiibacter alkanivorans TaxID=2267619 RepID=UPI000DF1EF74|nr:Hint domain-containing protein [Candidatus Halocynthiibacter alkanivorans]